jgi:hypothetical protein
MFFEDRSPQRKQGKSTATLAGAAGSNPNWFFHKSEFPNGLNYFCTRW